MKEKPQYLILPILPVGQVPSRLSREKPSRQRGGPATKVTTPHLPNALTIFETLLWILESKVVQSCAVRQSSYLCVT